MNDNTQTLKQPKVFTLAIVISAFERFGFYVIADSLILYLEKGFNFSDIKATALNSVFNALVFLTPAIGGYLADNVIGIRRSAILGLILEGLGLTLLTVAGPVLLYPALTLIILGVGFFKTTPTNLMARDYQKNDPRIDSGYTLFYMTMNIGSAISGILAGFFQRYFGWHIVFLCAAIGLYLGLLAYMLLRHRAKGLDVNVGKIKLPVKNQLKLIIGVIICCLIFIFLLSRPIIAQFFFYIATIAILLYFTHEIAKSSKQEKFAIIACLSLIFIAMGFFIMYFQLYMSVTLFIDRSVVHNILGFNIPTIAFISFNPFWIIILSPALVWIYRFLNKRGGDLAITTKFSLGILIISLCFLSLKLSTFFPNPEFKVAGTWIIFALFLYSLGELLISALGVAMIAHIAPKRLYGVMMGTWFLIPFSLGSTFAGKISSLAAIPKTLQDPAMILNIYGNIFLEIGISGIVIAIIAFIAGPHIRRMTNI